MQVDVKCSVSNCTFWQDANECAAPAIMVTMGQNANQNFKEEIAGEIMVDLQRRDTASTSSETCCHTFKARS